MKGEKHVRGGSSYPHHYLNGPFAQQTFDCESMKRHSCYYCNNSDGFVAQYQEHKTIAAINNFTFFTPVLFLLWHVKMIVTYSITPTSA